MRRATAQRRGQMRREFGFNLHAQSDEVGGCDPEPPLPLAQKSLLAQFLARIQKKQSRMKRFQQTLTSCRGSSVAGQRNNPPRRRTDGGGIAELSSRQRADL